MGLTTGSGPFGPHPGGDFDFERPKERVLYLEDSPRWVRVEVGGEFVASSRDVKLLHETGLQPVYYFPDRDVRGDLLEPSERTTTCPLKGEASYYDIVVGDRRVEDAVWTYRDPIEGASQLAGLLAFYFDRVDRWLEEDQEIGVHPRDPYHRVDAVPSSRHVEVVVDGETVAVSDRPMMVFETSLPPRFYLPREDVRAELLLDSDEHTECPYKGTASYHSVKTAGDVHEDLVWYYPEPHDEVRAIAGLLSFYNERVDLIVDGEPWERPESPFS